MIRASCWCAILWEVLLIDLYLGLDEIDGGGDDGAEFPCPFCSEDFDIVGLCCHIDEEHPVEANTGVITSWILLL